MPNPAHHSTIRLCRPSTGEVLVTRPSKISKSNATVESDSCVCEDYLTEDCPHSELCPLVHVRWRDTWPFILPRLHTVHRSNRGSTSVYMEGFQLQCFSPDFYYFYDSIPSQQIIATDGSAKFIQLFNADGSNFKDKVKLCRRYCRGLRKLHESGTSSVDCLSLGDTLFDFCSKGEQCLDIHMAVYPLDHLERSLTHIPSERAARKCQYERLPRNVQVQVYIPPKRAASLPPDTVFHGDEVLRTMGSSQYEEQYHQNGDAVPPSKFQHCVHFVQNRLCRLGPKCSFLHIMHKDVCNSPDSGIDTSESDVEYDEALHNHAALLAATDFLGADAPEWTPPAPSNHSVHRVSRRASPVLVSLPGPGDITVPLPHNGRTSPVNQSGRTSPTRRHNPYEVSPMERKL